MNRDLQGYFFTAKRERSRVDRDLEKYKLRLLVQVSPPTTRCAHYKLRLRLAAPITNRKRRDHRHGRDGRAAV